MTSAKIDLKKQHKALFAPKKTPEIVSVPRLAYLMIDGRGAPESDAFMDAVAALYSAAYTLKFLVKGGGRTDFAVAPLGARWWADDWDAFIAGRREEWQWTAMILQPDHVAAADFDATLDELARKKKCTAAHDRLRLETLEEGPCVQVLHLGPYADEGPAIAAMHAFAEAQGYALTGRHHEVYLSDPRRTAPEKLKTVLRQQLKR
jgi:hypothetical protein